MEDGEEQIPLPHDFMQADVDHIVLLIGILKLFSRQLSLTHLTNAVDMLDRIIVHNDQIPLSPSVEMSQIDILDALLSRNSESLTRFHSRTPPAISLLDYLRRIVKFAKVEVQCPFLFHTLIKPTYICRDPAY